MTEQCSARFDETTVPEGTSLPLDGNHVVEWFCRWHKPIGKWLRQRGLVGVADVEDVAQEVFLRLLRYSETTVIQNPQSYLFRIAMNVATEWRGRCSARQPHNECWLEQLKIDERDEPESTLVRMRTNQHLRALLERLPVRQREVLLLHVNDGLSYKEISRVRGLTVLMVRRDLRRARAKLRMQLKAENHWDGTRNAKSQGSRRLRR